MVIETSVMQPARKFEMERKEWFIKTYPHENQQESPHRGKNHFAVLYHTIIYPFYNFFCYLGSII